MLPIQLQDYHYLAGCRSAGEDTGVQCQRTMVEEAEILSKGNAFMKLKMLKPNINRIADAKSILLLKDNVKPPPDMMSIV